VDGGQCCKSVGAILGQRRRVNDDDAKAGHDRRLVEDGFHDEEILTGKREEDQITVIRNYSTRQARWL